MKNNLVVLSLVAAFTLLSSFAFAGTGVGMRISVPFDFYLGDQKLPAGEYDFDMGSGFLPTAAVVTVRAKNGTGIWVMATQAGTNQDASANQLSFNQYGDKQFLSSVSIQGFQAGVRMLKLEAETRTQLQKEKSTVVIAQK
jgi:hypothetical protein